MFKSHAKHAVLFCERLSVNNLSYCMTRQPGKFCAQYWMCYNDFSLHWLSTFKKINFIDSWFPLPVSGSHAWCQRHLQQLAKPKTWHVLLLVPVQMLPFVVDQKPELIENNSGYINLKIEYFCHLSDVFIIGFQLRNSIRIRISWSLRRILLENSEQFCSSHA